MSVSINTKYSDTIFTSIHLHIENLIQKISTKSKTVIAADIHTWNKQKNDPLNLNNSTIYKYDKNDKIVSICWDLALKANLFDGFRASTPSPREYGVNGKAVCVWVRSKTAHHKKTAFTIIVLKIEESPSAGAARARRR